MSILTNIKCKIGLHQLETKTLKEIGEEWGDTWETTSYKKGKGDKEWIEEPTDSPTYSVCKNCGYGDPYLTGEF